MPARANDDTVAKSNFFMDPPPNPLPETRPYSPASPLRNGKAHSQTGCPTILARCCAFATHLAQRHARMWQDAAMTVRLRFSGQARFGGPKSQMLVPES